jgi:hypothetical protein
MSRFLRLASLVTLVFALGASEAFAKAKITIITGEGFSDPTPVAPAGGNPGTTIGEQRVNAANRAAEIWSEALESSVEIIVNVSFQNLECGSDGAVLGSAGPVTVFANFDNAPKTNVFYPVALANKLAGRDLSPLGDIVARFNARIDAADCLGDANWYYGFDGNNGPDSDFLVVFLHELGHGLGFSSGVNSDTGQFRNNNLPGIYDLFLFDNTAGLSWDQMSTTQRFSSITNDQNVVWTGPSVVGAAGGKLGPTPVLRVNEPSSIAKTYTIGSASFGPAATVAGLTGNVAAATDAVEPATAEDPAGTNLDGCSAFTNASAVAGRFALVDRGRCAFVQKAVNAQAAGAIGVIIVDNVVRLTPPGLGHTDGAAAASVRIPVYSLTRPDGQGIRDQLAGGVGVTLFADATRLVGADLMRRVKLFMPSEVQPGSSVSHWDVSAFPNLLMEPSINDDLLPVLDITPNQMYDIGWTAPAGNPVQPPPPTPPTTGRRVLRRGR